MTIYGYYDVLDTVRCGIRWGTRGEEGRKLAQAQLFLSILLGKTPVLSQTQGFDSSLILEAAIGDDHRYIVGAFRMGRIRIHRFRTMGLLDAFKGALSKPSFVFSAWPEIPEKNSNASSDPRKAILAWIEDEKTHDLEQKVCSRLAILKSIDAAEKELGDRQEAIPTPTNLQVLLSQVREKVVDKNLASILRNLPDTNDRSVLYDHFNSLQSENEIAARSIARSIVDICYNKIICESVMGAIDPLKQEYLLTAAEEMAISATESIGMPEPTKCDVLEEEELRKSLTALDWKILSDFCDEYQRYPGSDSLRLAETAGLLAKTQLEEGEDVLSFVVRNNPLIVDAVVAGISTAAAIVSSTSPVAGVMISSFSVVLSHKLNERLQPPIHKKALEHKKRKLVGWLNKSENRNTTDS